MAIVYSYEQATQPAFGDLLLGTDVSASGKPTKSFSIQSIVDLVQTGVPGGGTVTSIGTNSSTFVTLSGGPITTSGIVSASLSATGTPSATTYLRGDNTWATIGASENTTYTVTSAQNGSAANIRLTGSDSSQTIVTLAAGPNVVLTDNGTNRITIGLTGLAAGSVTSVTTGAGLSIISGIATINPVIAVDYLGLNNYIKVNESQATPTSDDIIPFDQVSSTNVKTTNLGAIPITALTSVKSYVDAGDVGDIRNDTDTFATTAAVNNVVSLTSAEYTALATKNANTLYIVVASAASFTTTLAFTNNIVGTEYTINGDQAGATKSGIAGASYAYNTTLTPNAGFFFSSGPTVTNATGTFSVDETVNTILAGTVQAVAVDDVVATLAVSTSGISGTEFTLGGNISGDTITGPSPLAYAFNTTISPNAGFEWASGPTISNASGTITTSQTVVTTITGELQAVAPPSVVVTPSIQTDFIGSFPTQFNTPTVTPGSFSGESPVAYNFIASVTANAGYYFADGPTIGGDVSGSATSSKTAIITISGQIEESVTQAIVNLTVDENAVNGSTSWYTLGGDLTGAQQSGDVPFNYAFNTTAAANTGYVWTSGPTINNAAGQETVAGTYPVTTTISGTIALAATDPVATLIVNTSGITGEQVFSVTGDQSGAQQSGTTPFTYSFTTGVSIPGGYEWTSGPAISPTQPNTDEITEDTSTTTTITGNISAIPDSYYTLFKCSTQSGGFTSNQTTAQISLITNDQIYDLVNTSETYIVTGTSTSQGAGVSVSSSQGTGCPPTLYYYIIENCANSSQLQYGYSTQPNLGSGDTFNYFSNCYKYYDVDPTESGTIDLDALSTCQCGPEQGTVNLTFSNSVNGSANTTPTLPAFNSVTQDVGTTYTFTNSIVAKTGFEFTAGPTWNPSPVITGTVISGTTNLTQTVTGIVVAIPDEVTVTLAFTNNVTNNQFTTTSLTPGATITGNPGDSYQFVHVITADTGYEFTSGPTWTDSVSNNGTGTINGTIPNSNTTITQSVSGVVEASGVTVYNQQITAEEDGGFGTPSTPAATAKTELCFQFLPFSAYSEDANITDAIQLNARWFADSGGSNPFSGGFKWYGVGTPEDLGAVYIIRISDAGIVTETTTAC